MKLNSMIYNETMTAVNTGNSPGSENGGGVGGGHGGAQQQAKKKKSFAAFQIVDEHNCGNKKTFSMFFVYTVDYGVLHSKIKTILKICKVSLVYEICLQIVDFM